MKFHKSTNLGIEVEICVEKEMYRSLRTKRNNGELIYKYPEGQDPFRNVNTNNINNLGNSIRNSNSNSNSNSNNLKDIILTDDITCKCNEGKEKKTHIPAEIVSPRMKPNELPFFYSFLEEQLMHDMSKIEQAKTCGIHIHWSNSELQLYPNDYNYMFEFIRILYHLRKYFNTKVVDVGFSGRLHQYDDIIQKPIIITPKTPEIENTFFICNPIEVKMDNDITLIDIEEQLLDTDLSIYQWREPENFNRIKDLFVYMHEEKLDLFLIMFFVISISNKESFLTKELGFEKNIGDRWIDLTDEELLKCMDFVQKKSKELYDFNNLAKLFSEVQKIYEDPYNRFGGFALEGYMSFSINRVVGEEFNVIMGKTQDIMKDFYTLMSSRKSRNMKKRSIKFLPTELRDRLFLEKKGKLSLFPETVTHEFIINSLQKNFHKSGMSLYDLDGFHMEMRIFSLDDLFRREKEVNAQKVVEEIHSFVEKTEHFFVKILDRLNKMYDPVKKEIPEGKKKLYDEFFLMDKTYQPRNRVVTEKLRELFGIEKMRESTSSARARIKSSLRRTRTKIKPTLTRTRTRTRTRIPTKIARRNYNSLYNSLYN
jgi:hypothetical protein